MSEFIFREFIYDLICNIKKGIREKIADVETIENLSKLH